MKGTRGYGLIFVIIIAIGLAFLTTRIYSGQDNTEYNMEQFKSDIASGNIATIEIVQNPEVPTGVLKIVKTDNTKKNLYVPNVNSILQYLDNNHFTNVKVNDVTGTPWYVNILPYVLIAIMLFLFMSMMTSR